MKQVLVRKGRVVVEDVPSPIVEAGTVLVETRCSCISAGTEMSGIKMSARPLWRRALDRPEKVGRALKMVASQGVVRTWREVDSGSAGTPTGYSAAGVVLQTGEGIDDLVVGDRVACGGAQWAHHAEVLRVPRNLVVRVPDSLDWSAASTVTIGAIALQGVRRAQPTLGETFVVVGLGILGQLTAQILKANGCRVIGTDLDRKRIALAASLGMDVGIHPEDGVDVDQVARLTDGLGADGVIIAASSPSNAVVSTAFKMCRKKGRVVLVGDVGLSLNRAEIYEKEIDFLISSSYGPGRYDRTYEERGLDYPAPYVRWTENRNMAEYLRLVEDKRIRLDDLISSVMPVEQAHAAFAHLKQAENRPMIVLLSYCDGGQQKAPSHTIRFGNRGSKRSGRVQLAVVGAGSFAKGTHLPNLNELRDRFQLRAVVSRTGHNANAVAKLYGAEYATTDLDEVLCDKDIEAVLIATRHDLHAQQVLAALKAGKHVLVEKPLGLRSSELADIERFFADNSNEAPVLLTGFNRRFSPYAVRLRELTRTRSNPMVLTYRMNAGHIPLGHWVHGPEGGGRNLGEACHIYDLFTFLTDAKVTSVTAAPIKPNTAFYGVTDNFVATLTFADGSVASLAYTAMGAKEFPKEHLEVYVDGKVLVVDDYRRMDVFGAAVKGVASVRQEKGQKAELEAFADAVRQRREWPSPLWHQIQAMEIALQVEQFLEGHRPAGLETRQ